MLLSRRIRNIQDKALTESRRLKIAYPNSSLPPGAGEGDTPRGLRERFKTIVGGAPCTQRWADKIGADAYGEDASDAVTKCLELIQK